MSYVAPGTCRHCGCHGEGHKLEDGEECCWIDPSRTVCSAPGCMIAEGQRRAAFDGKSERLQREREKERRARWARPRRKRRAA